MHFVTVHLDPHFTGSGATWGFSMRQSSRTAVGNGCRLALSTAQERRVVGEKVSGGGRSMAGVGHLAGCPAGMLCTGQAHSPASNTMPRVVPHRVFIGSANPVIDHHRFSGPRRRPT
jgi:hypothetical protein